MNKIGGAVILFFLVLFAYTKLAGPIPFSVTSVTTTKTDTFTVSGEGKVPVKPDIAIITVGVEAAGSTVKTAQDALNRSINAVAANVKKVGVENKDIQTTNYNINPTYTYNDQTQKITGYQASSNLTIKIRAIDTANTVIDAATAAGANNVGGIAFDVDDKTKIQNDAREIAVADAKKKAENAAKIAGFSLGRIINYSEDFGAAPRPILMMAKADSAQTPPSTSIEPGTNEIIVNVSLSYEIR